MKQHYKIKRTGYILHVVAQPPRM